MSDFKGPVINKKRGGLGRTSSENKDSIRGLVAGAVAVSGKFALGTIYKLIQLSDAEALGINAAYDTTNKCLLYNHIARFFHYAPDGVLYVMGMAKGTTLANMCDITQQGVYKLVTDESTKREITRVGVVLNPLDAYAPTYTTGVDADVLAAITKAQELGVTLANMAIRFDGVVIEGRLEAAASIATLPNLRALASEYVSVVIAQDPAVAALDAMFVRYADVGSLLGMSAVRMVHECVGSVDIINKPQGRKSEEVYSLTNKSNSYYLSAKISNGTLFSKITEAEKGVLSTKGYIYAGKYEGLDGFYFSDSHTCIEATDDYAYMEDNQVFNKAAQLVRQALLPVMKGTVPVDPATGYIRPSVAASYEAKGLKKLKQMLNAGELESADLKVLPNQDVIGTSEVIMSLGYVKAGIVRKLQVNIGAVNPAALT